jgi:hypothetical protein
MLERRRFLLQITTITISMYVEIILEYLEKTVPVHRNDTLATHMQYIRTLEDLLHKLVGIVYTSATSN